MPSTLCLFLTYNSSLHYVHLISHLGVPDQNLISALGLIAPVQPQDLSRKRCYRQYGSARWKDQMQYILYFPWNDCCFNVRDSSLCAQRITEVVVSGMKARISSTFPFMLKQPWFNEACFLAIIKRQPALRR